jgi:hypothetical protein
VLAGGVSNDFNGSLPESDFTVGEAVTSDEDLIESDLSSGRDVDTDVVLYEDDGIEELYVSLCEK